jgi:hypothetical protein
VTPLEVIGTLAAAGLAWRGVTWTASGLLLGIPARVVAGAFCGLGCAGLLRVLL